MHPPKGYKYLSLLGDGQATTWIAESDDDRQVVIKTLELKNVSDWKGIELFEREMTVLQQLEHLSIPKFINFIKDEHAGSKRWHIVQEKVDGKILDPQYSWSESELRDLAKSVLESLVYLQGFSPPLLHRDIKPSNVLRKNDGYALIDFGVVRHVVPSEAGGSTVVGTSGYMAPEQLMGRADKSSDLYGLGATMIHLISSQHPDDLGTKRMKIQWSDPSGKLSPDLLLFVNRLTEPHAENRFNSAQEALANLGRPIGPPNNLIRRGSSWINISLNSKRDVLRVRGLRVGFEAAVDLFFLVPFMSLILLTIYALTSPVGNTLLFNGAVIFCSIASLIGFVKVDRVKATFRYSKKGIEMTGLIEDGVLSEAEQAELELGLQELANLYRIQKSEVKAIEMDGDV